ncbi:MAG: lipopolysaccharide biosynthesis protein [Clostridia bacterium]|nr:lipopolysaccharide biosynthesis protein [Clostridia bacterium]
MSQKSNKLGFVSGVFWSYSEKFGAEIVGFIVSVILARILSPSHYGTIALVNVFIQIANTFVTAGFGNSLIQKKDADDLDFSSIFFFSLGFSGFLYLVLFFTAPLIGGFYNDPSLALVVRIMALRLPIAAINSIQRAYVSKHMMFRKFFFATLGGTLVAAGVGIVMAYNGCGVWALVAQYLINATIDTLVLFLTVKWRPKLMFSFARAGALISYGWKLLGAALLNTLYANLSNLLIAKKYSTADLAYYSKGYNYPRLIADNINASVSEVLFPYLSKQQDDRVRLKTTLRYTNRVLMFIISPLLVGFALVAEPLIRVLLTDKWLPCAPFIVVMCAVWLLQPIQSSFIQAMKAIGTSGLYLKLEIVKKIASLGVLLVAVFCFNDPIYIAYSLLIGQVMAIVINFFFSIQLFSYTVFEQLGDCLLSVLLSLTMIVPIYFINRYVPDLYLSLALQMLAGAGTYIAVNLLVRPQGYHGFLAVVRQLLNRKKKSGQTD